MFVALYAAENGEIYDDPAMLAVGRSGNKDTVIQQADMILLPEGSELMFLPGRSAVAWQKDSVSQLPGNKKAVAAILPAGYTRTLLPSYYRQPGSEILPLYGYAAVALYKEKIYVAAIKTDDNARWHPFLYNTADLKKRVKKVKTELANNSIVNQLAGCSLKWHCCTAQNLFYQRWEAGIPVSPSCNADCLGCISLQSSECCPSAQNRISEAPSVEEIVAVGSYHLSNAPYPIISFGQGCEGEPSLEAARIAEAISCIRQRTGRGLININTNGGYTAGLQQIIDAGLQQMRVSMISAVEKTHKAYYRACYSLKDVMASIEYAKQRGVFVSINMLLFPGLNDCPEEISAWIKFIKTAKVDMLQLRNLNIDPDMFLSKMPLQEGQPLGVRTFIKTLQEACPSIKIGNFTHYIQESE